MANSNRLDAIEFLGEYDELCLELLERLDKYFNLKDLKKMPGAKLDVQKKYRNLMDDLRDEKKGYDGRDRLNVFEAHFTSQAIRKATPQRTFPVSSNPTARWSNEVTSAKKEIKVFLDQLKRIGDNWKPPE